MNNTQGKGTQGTGANGRSAVPVRKIPGSGTTGKPLGNGNGTGTTGRSSGAGTRSTGTAQGSGRSGAGTTGGRTSAGRSAPTATAGTGGKARRGGTVTSGSREVYTTERSGGGAGIIPESVRPYINKRTVTIAVILILVVMNLIAFMRIEQTKIPERVSADEVKAASEIDLEKVFTPPYDTARVYSADSQSGNLILVNGTYAFKDSYKGRDIASPSLVQVNRLIRDKSFKARDNTIQLTPEMVEALNLMFADYVAQGGPRDVMVNEAYRTHEYQQKIYDSKVKQLGKDQKIAQKPGYSEHHTGYAVDLSIYPDGGKGARTFSREERNEWIYDNCHKYGLIHRYAESKTEITGIAPESWHFRYVGVPHATYMYERGITLEEYLSEIRIYTESIPLKVVANGEEYGIYYVEAEALEYTEFNVPKDTEYSISGDNMGGFVVWYKTGVVTGEPETAVPDEAPEA